MRDIQPSELRVTVGPKDITLRVWPRGARGVVTTTGGVEVNPDIWDGSCPACDELCDGDGCECSDDCPVPAGRPQ